MDTDGHGSEAVARSLWLTQAVSEQRSPKSVLIRVHPWLMTSSCADNCCRRRGNLYLIGMRFRVHVEADEDGVFVAECPTLPGCISQGQTRSEALDNIKDAIAGYLFSLEKHGEAVPLPVNEEVVEVPA
jgi:antitoxin HicB